MNYKDMHPTEQFGYIGAVVSVAVGYVNLPASAVLGITAWAIVFWGQHLRWLAALERHSKTITI